METTFSKILIGFDQSASSDIALRKGLELAEKFNAEVHVVYVEIPGHSYNWVGVNEYIDTWKKKTGREIHVIHKIGKAFKEIVNTEKEIGADLILIGSHSAGGFMPFWIGSTAFRVVSSSKCPVITMQESAVDAHFNSLIVPLDSSTESRQKLKHVAVFAQALDATAHILCVSKDKDQDTLNHLNVYCNQAADFFESKKIPYTTERKVGVNVAQTVIDYAKEKNSGMIFMMTETESAGMFMGTIAQQLINHSPYPVMSIHNKHVEGVVGGGI